MKNLKGILFVIVLVATASLAVLGYVFSEYAKTKFWWTAWDIVAPVSAVVFVLLILWYVNKKKQW